MNNCDLTKHVKQIQKYTLTAISIEAITIPQYVKIRISQNFSIISGLYNKLNIVAALIKYFNKNCQRINVFLIHSAFFHHTDHKWFSVILHPYHSIRLINIK